MLTQVLIIFVTLLFSIQAELIVEVNTKLMIGSDDPATYI